MTPLEQAREALQDPLSRGPTWALIERYADAVCEYNRALRIDVGVDKAGAECLAVEKELRAHLAALSAQEVPAGFVPMSAWLAACAFIDSHAADPDITDEMTRAYAEFTRQRAMLTAAPAAPKQAEAWRPIETAPKDGRKLILAYTNLNGKARTVMGCWVTDEEAAETDADDVGLEAGWYECIDNWPDYTQVAIHEGEPSHWMPLPSAPAAPRG